MEVYAGCLAYCDSNIGRVIQAVEDTGELDNTLIIFIMGDNGASGEGTLQGLANEVGVAGNGVEKCKAPVFLWEREVALSKAIDGVQDVRRVLVKVCARIESGE